MKQVYTIDMKLPSLNDYINVCRTNKYKAAKYKADIEQQIAGFLIKMPQYEHPIRIHFHWIEGNKKRDLDNVCFAKKFILDAMVKSKKLKNDNRKHVRGFTDTFYYGEETKVIVEVEREI
jgi:Holliday junction resolvase RusA-like endonuclease